MVEKNEGLSQSHQMGLLKCSKPMHTLFECTLLHVQEPMHDVVVSMQVEKDLNPFPKSLRSQSVSFNHVLLLQCFPIACYVLIEACTSLLMTAQVINDLSQHLKEEKTNTIKPLIWWCEALLVQYQLLNILVGPYMRNF